MRVVANGALLVIMGALAALFLGGMEGGHIALAGHNAKDTKVFENSHINVETDTGQRQDCETAGGTSPISNSCTASSSNTITQGTPPAPPSSCTSTSHPTVLTLSVSPTSVRGGDTDSVISTGTLTDTCTGSGVTGAAIAGIVTDATGVVVGEWGRSIVTDGTGTYSVRGFLAPLPTGTLEVQAHFTGQGIFGPSNSQTQTLTVLP